MSTSHKTARAAPFLPGFTNSPWTPGNSAGLAACRRCRHFRTCAPQTPATPTRDAASDTAPGADPGVLSASIVRLPRAKSEDLLKYGLIPEFVGRLPVVATLEDLDELSLKRILTEPKNALVKQYQRLFEMEGVELTLAEEALGAIARKAIDRKTGARGLRSIMEGILLDTMFDLPGLEGVEKVVISREVVEGSAQPLYIYAIRAGNAGASAS